MTSFALPTKVEKFVSFQSFAEKLELGKEDLIVTHEFLYKAFMASSAGEARFLFQERYGTGEPNDEMINAILADARKLPFRRIIAIGGGTVLDIAKLLVLKDVTNVVDAFERKIPLVKACPLVCVPTTCGTGSEVTMITIAELKSKKTKLGLADPVLFPDTAALIPELLGGLPAPVFVSSAIDALVHAVESYVSPKANDYTRAFSVQATKTFIDIFRKMAERGPEYRKERLDDAVVAANMAGIAFGNAGVGAVHALAYPLGAAHHVPHGEANFACFTGVFKVYQKKQPLGRSLQEVEKLLCEALGSTPEHVYEDLDILLGRVIEQKPLRKYGMTEAEIEEFADSVIEKQQRLLANNYVALTRDEIRDIYKSLF